MSQNNLAEFFETCWQDKIDHTKTESDLSYSHPIEDALIYPIYKEIISELNIPANGGRILDVGCGSGRWVRYFSREFSPSRLLGLDLAISSIKLLEKWYSKINEIDISFAQADITSAKINLTETFDLVNVANVLFHIVDHDPFLQAIKNLKTVLEPNGYIFTTEYLPKTTLRSNMMLVHNRDDFERVINHVGLRIVDIRATSFFANDPMGLDASEESLRNEFLTVKSAINKMLSEQIDEQKHTRTVNLFASLEHTLLKFCKSRMDDVDLPSQKLVVLTHT